MLMFANSMSINETVKKLLNVYKITAKLTALSCYFSLFKTPVVLDCRQEVLGVSDPWATSLMSISMIARLEALLGCMMSGVDMT